MVTGERKKGVQFSVEDYEQSSEVKASGQAGKRHTKWSVDDVEKLMKEAEEGNWGAIMDLRDLTQESRPQYNQEWLETLDEGEKKQLVTLVHKQLLREKLLDVVGQNPEQTEVKLGGDVCVQRNRYVIALYKQLDAKIDSLQQEFQSFLGLGQEMKALGESLLSKAVKATNKDNPKERLVKEKAANLEKKKKERTDQEKLQRKIRGLQKKIKKNEENLKALEDQTSTYSSRVDANKQRDGLKETLLASISRWKELLKEYSSQQKSQPSTSGKNP